MNEIHSNVRGGTRNDLLRIYIKNHFSFFYIPLLASLVFVFLRFYFLGYVDNEQIIAGSLLLFISSIFFINQQRLYKNFINNKDSSPTAIMMLKIMINKAGYVLPWLFIFFFPHKTGYFFDQSLGFIMVFLTIGFYTSISSANLVLLSYDIALQVIFCAFILLLNWSNIEAPYILSAVFLFTAYSYWIGLKLNKSVKELADKNRQLQLKTAEANKANQAKSDFLAMMSHEIRTPLHGIMSTIENLCDTKVSKKQEESLNVISRCANVLLAMLNNVLDLSKIEAKKINIEKIEFNFHELISDIVQTNVSIAQKKGIVLENKVSDKVPQFITSDPIKMHQIILNLVSNALKFTQEGSVKLQVSYSSTDHIITIKVQDTGIGIAEENIDRLFSAFEQEDVSTVRSFGGTGLGLPIVKKLVEILDGTVNVSSQKGQGSIFTVCMPVLASSVMTRSKKQPLEKKVEFDLKSCRVLVAEDNDISKINISQSLKKHACSPDLVSDGLEAVNKADECLYDIILMDMNMPNLNGIEATKKIKEGINKNTPIIGLSAVTQEEILHKFYLAGIIEHVVKPFDRNTFLNVIMRYQPADKSEIKEKIDQIYDDFEPSFCKKFIKKSFDEIQKLHFTLKNFAAKNDIENIYKTSHELCGIAGNIGMRKTYSQSKNIEDLSLNNAEIYLLAVKIEYLTDTIDSETRLIKEYIRRNN